jgi:RTX calcium-binding nonapeptide repeat (4 copies)
LRSLRRLALPVVLALLGVAATPAHATLFVESHASGLIIRDQHNLSDVVRLYASTHQGSPGYGIRNLNDGDFFKFARGQGCDSGEDRTNPIATCFRNGPRISVVLLEGSDLLNMGGTQGGDPPPPTGESSVSGGPGNDTVFGHPGIDSVNGGTGEDTLRGGRGNDTLDGAENADRLEGGDGNDTLLGEGNADVLIGGLGDDVLRGGASNDFIESKEPTGSTSVDDGVDCGNGFDTVDADLKDSIQADCEEVDRSPVGETPHVTIPAKTLRVSGAGQVSVPLRCPRGVRSLGCNGTLQLALDTRSARTSRSRKSRYTIKAGRRKAVRLRLSAGDVSKLRRNQGRRKKTRGVLTSIEKGRIGLKTTIRNPSLRLG